MALTVEDGSQVPGANSYVSDSDYTTYAAARGYSVGADATTREQELLKAMDYFESFRDRFKGLKVGDDQPLQWPRISVFIDGFQKDSNEIPIEVKRAQMELAILSRDTSLVPSGCREDVASQSIGELSVSYHKGGSWQTVQMNNVKQYLDILLENASSIRSVRV